jgi:acetylornithine deacetylase/succinyl-diaminopimelate desuccinylase-like protein
MPTERYSQLISAITAAFPATLVELAELCGQPSVSASGWGIPECAELVCRLLRKRGFAVQVFTANGVPLIYGEYRHPTSSKTLLCYHHYDVQPAGDLTLWQSPPFEPQVRNGALYARGALDDKGQLISRLAALDAIKAVSGSYPCNLKFIIEGEEETGSTGIQAFLPEHSDLLKADACIWEFGGVNAQDIPLQFLGLRGIACFELRLRTLKRDAHSGLGGAIFPNAAWRLTWALASLKDRFERVQIPGFYDNVRPPSTTDWQMAAEIPSQRDYYRQMFGVQEFLRTAHSSAEAYLQEVFEPTCTICGLTSGYQGPGSMTVLPAIASAKLDFRLVPDQMPAEIAQKLRAYLDAQGFDDIELVDLGGAPPGRTDPHHPFVKLAVETAEQAYGKKPIIYPMNGASGPNYVFLNYLNLPVITAGVGHPGGGVHGPNEHVRLDLLEIAIRHLALLILRFGNSD